MSPGFLAGKNAKNPQAFATETFTDLSRRSTNSIIIIIIIILTCDECGNQPV